MARFLIATAVISAIIATPAMAGNAPAGARVFKTQCAICHATSATAAPGVGPNLAGVVGRKAGTQSAFANRYSPAMKQAGLVWSPETLKTYITNPAKTVPGNKMPFAGLHDTTQAEDVAAYLQSLR